MCFFLLKASYLGWSSYDPEALHEAGVCIGTQNGKQCGGQLCYTGFGWCLCLEVLSGVLQTSGLEHVYCWPPAHSSMRCPPGDSRTCCKAPGKGLVR